MTRFSASLGAATLALLLFVSAIPAQSQDDASDSAAVSKVRIVRLSEVRGLVQVDRNSGQGYGPAITNLPIVQGNRVKTANGVAEVEFEDNSTLRLGPNSEAEFTALGRTSTGSTVSSVRLLSGTAYVSLLKNSGKTANDFELSFGNRKLPLEPGSHVRLEIDNTETGQAAKLAVLDGSLRVNGPDGVLDVSHNRQVSFALADQTAPTVAKGFAEGSLDEWDKQSVQYHQRIASFTGSGSMPYTYGLSDMRYYGGFSDVGGCGMMWRPYFAGAAWEPYGVGAWAYFADAGYSWVSPYPWGWMPYHYGSWSYCPGTGWGWQPGGAWMPLRNIIAKGTNPTRPHGGPVLPTPPHLKETYSLVLLEHRTTPVRSDIDLTTRSFVFREGSAGLGIPRGELGNLKGVSGRVAERGSVSTPVYASGRGYGYTAHAGAGGSGSGYAPVSIHRGSSAPSVSSGSYSGGERSGGFSGSSAHGSVSVSSAPSSSFSSASSSGGGGGGSHH